MRQLVRSLFLTDTMHGSRRLNATCIIAATLLGGGRLVGQQPARLTPAQMSARPNTITDPAAYAVYAVALLPMWNGAAAGSPLLLQVETTGPGLLESMSKCFPLATAADDPEWLAVEEDFKQANVGVRVLQPLLHLAVPYRFVTRADIEADDKRLALKYPDSWQRRPESFDYAAVSAVGFNQLKTKALVVVAGRRTPGPDWTITPLEQRDNRWVPARLSRGCVGPIA